MVRMRTFGPSRRPAIARVASIPSTSGSVRAIHATSSIRREQERRRTVRDAFHRFAHAAATTVGSPWAFTLALVAVGIWAVLGPRFGYSDTWQLVINTATTIVTFLIVFLIQNTQNRDTKALHLKLDELLRAISGARTSLVNLESLSDEQLEDLQKEFEEVNRRARRVENGEAANRKAK